MRLSPGSSVSEHAREIQEAWVRQQLQLEEAEREKGKEREGGGVGRLGGSQQVSHPLRQLRT